MQIRVATYSDRDSWDQYVLNHPDGTAYHFFAWKEAIEKAYGFECIYLIATGSSGICGLLPLVDFKIPLLSRTLLSLPYCDAGGVLADNPHIENEIINYARKSAENIRAGIKLRSTIPLQSCGTNKTDKVSMVMDLPDCSEKLWESFKSKFRLKIKTPIRDGFIAQTGRDNLLEDFYTVFSINMRHLGSPVHSRRWIEAVVSSYQERARVAVVYTPDKRPVAAGMILLHPSRISNPWSSSLRSYNAKRPNMLLYWSLLSFAADSGCKQFDFGRSTPDEGTYCFKQQWGAKPQPLYWYDLMGAKIVNKAESPKHRNANSKRQIAASLWQKIPQPGTEWLGPKVRKYISL